MKAPVQCGTRACNNNTASKLDSGTSNKENEIRGERCKVIYYFVVYISADEVCVRKYETMV